MKILYVIVISSLFTFPLYGQKRAMKHLYGDKGKDLSPMLSPTIQLTELMKELYYVPGIKAGVILNKKFTFGAIYNFTIKDKQLPKLKGNGSMGMKWGGVLFEYTLWPLQNVHLTLPFSAGMGQLNLLDTISVPGQRLTDNPSFIFAEPGLALEFNIWKYAKIEIGGGYRYTNNATNVIKAYDLSGFSFNVSLKFGLFDYQETKRERDRMKMLKEQRKKNEMELRNEKIIQERNDKLNEKINGPRNKKVKKRK
ncbi:MAG: hypothetical protein WCP85_16175 [Mariniphaga sp.]